MGTVVEVDGAGRGREGATTDGLGKRLLEEEGVLRCDEDWVESEMKDSTEARETLSAEYMGILLARGVGGRGVRGDRGLDRLDSWRTGVTGAPTSGELDTGPTGEVGGGDNVGEDMMTSSTVLFIGV